MGALLIVALSLYSALGVSFVVFSMRHKHFSQSLLIDDLIRLDAWALGFFCLLMLTWLSNCQHRTKVRVTLFAISAYGFVAGCLIFDGSPYSYNAYWGDQAFRQGMILKLMTFGWPGDFFYKHLPAFYPPIYFYLLSIVGIVANWEAFLLLKIGSLAIYLFGPPLLYGAWRAVVTPTKALGVVIFTFLLLSQSEAMPFYSPHAFLANIFFIPWWMVFVEGIGLQRLFEPPPI